MDKETLEASWGLVCGVAEEVRDFLFKDLSKWREEEVMLDSIDSAINELEGWKEAITTLNEKENEDGE